MVISVNMEMVISVNMMVTRVGLGAAEDAGNSTEQVKNGWPGFSGATHFLGQLVVT
jgi:hypothetical protein